MFALTFARSMRTQLNSTNFQQYMTRPFHTTTITCMNRNKRRVNKANHGARPCNSVGRKAKALGQGSWKVPRMNPTHNKVSTFENPDVILRQQRKEQMKRMWEMKNEAKRKEMEIIGNVKT